MFYSKCQVEEMKAEGINAIQSVQNLNLDPEYYELSKLHLIEVFFMDKVFNFIFPSEIEENEERSALEMNEKKKLEPLIKTLIEWINSELAEKRVIVKDIQEDFYDGQILRLLIGECLKFFLSYNLIAYNLNVTLFLKEKLSGLKFSSELHLGEMSQKQNLKLILDFINSTMDIHPLECKWKVESK